MSHVMQSKHVVFTHGRNIMLDVVAGRARVSAIVFSPKDQIAG